MSAPIIPVEDFWSRRANAQRHSFSFAPFGVPVEITANDEHALEAARLAAARYSRSDDNDAAPMRTQIVVQRTAAPPLPADWPERLVYSGAGDWITLSAGAWGYGFGNLQARTALVFLTPALAAETHSVSRYFVDHYVLNFLFNDWAMLHASGVLNPASNALILMIGAHNAGKSTTALRLLRAGYHFLADGMALLQLCDGRVRVGGYPIGEVKLRDDVLGEFPEYAGDGVNVREQRKTVVNLRAAHPERVVETVIAPDAIHLCFTERGQGAATALRPATREAAREWLAANTVFWDEPARLEHNSRVLNHLLVTAQLQHLTLGSDPAGILSVMEKLR
jgi:hypothetical protein